MPVIVPSGAITRRTLVGAGAAALAGTWAARAPAAAPGGARPNILCLVSEDCGAAHLRAYGGPVGTPTIERLAREGVRFANCFSAAPVCAPSRTAMLTGIPPESCGAAQHMRASGQLPHALAGRGFTAALREAGYYCTNNAKTDYNVPVDMRATWDASSAGAHWRHRPAGAPFFAIFNPQTTHEASVFGDIPGPARAADVQVPPYLPDTPAIRSDAVRYRNAIRLMDAELGLRLAEVRAAGLLDDTIVLFYSDHGGVLPRSKRFCLDSGLHIPLIARFGRNVAHLAPGPPGSVVDAPVSSGVDLPVTILGLAGLAPGPHMIGRPFAGPHRRARRYAFSMRNRMDERHDIQRTARDARYRYVRNYLPHLPYGQHVTFMFLQRGYRQWRSLHRQGRLDATQAAFWERKAAEELYDTHEDPHEVRNLAGDPAHGAVLARMRTALDEHMLAVNDNAFIPEGAPGEGYDASRAGDYPLRELLDLTSRAIRGRAGTVPELTAALADPRMLLRYWGAVGFSMLRDPADGAPGRSALTRAFAGDASLYVRVAAAEALARQGDRRATVPFLGRLLVDRSVSHPARLYAVNALGNLGAAARPAWPQLLAAAISTDRGGLPEPYVQEAATRTLMVLAGRG